ncbi:IMPACT family protein [Rhizobiaceae bacterium n13]|uniref:IMPACT family protein n=1 Tax=Ferirhizobium litorale TaxID=2927786 RepID=A0AAE3U480_9HYPH|nr:YigZ family protein [Fererhizobium litorale]MDI7861989.1 IMPACT family protein [Fererhizobium litorale]MDI7922739.1 IMPACT family protein [Fererhizobium litorale]
MFTLEHVASLSQEIKKSRFLAVAGPVADERAAKEFIAAHADPSANHNCWAWRIGQAYRFSDDGEPSGTAGKPILQAVDGQKLDHVAVVVTRWFGGILLGSGGLMRAYGGTAAMCLREAEKVEAIETARAVIECEFSDLALLKARLQSLGVAFNAEAFTATGACLTVEVARDSAQAVSMLVSDLTRGKSQAIFDD